MTIVDLRLTKDRLQNDLRFCFQKNLSFKAFWTQCNISYFVTIPNHKNLLSQNQCCFLCTKTQQTLATFDLDIYTIHLPNQVFLAQF